MLYRVFAGETEVGRVRGRTHPEALGLAARVFGGHRGLRVVPARWPVLCQCYRPRGARMRRCDNPARYRVRYGRVAGHVVCEGCKREWAKAMGSHLQPCEFVPLGEAAPPE
jgi:hypothetical protein